MSRIAFVVTCKGRLHHLRQSLPRLAAQPGSTCVVVDYDCPDGCGAWVGENFPAVRVVRVTDAPRFRIAHARNVGAGAAEAPWLCFVDADVLVGEDFAATVEPMLQAGCFYRPLPLTWNTWGTTLCMRDDFRRIGGYDEVLEGWGGEDDDLYYRLATRGCRQAGFPATLVDAVPHADDERTRHYDVQDKWANQRANALYLQVKYDVGRQLGLAELPRETPAAIYGEVRRTVLQSAAGAAAATRFEVSLPPRLDIPLAPGWAMTRRLVYQLAPAAEAPVRENTNA